MGVKIFRAGMAVILLAGLLVSGCSGANLAADGDTVKVHYTGRLGNGVVFDTSIGGEPLEFTLGQEQVIPGFEQAVIGMKVGDSKTVGIPVDQAYGPYRDDMVFEFDRSEIPTDVDPMVGLQLQMYQPDGSVVIVTIIEVTESTVKLDANHSLAGEDLIFDIELVEIVKAQGGSNDSGLTLMPLGDALANGLPTLAEFGSSSCIPCKEMKPILEQLAIEYEGRLNVVIVEVYEQAALAQTHKIMAIPTQVIFDGSGKEITRHIGLWPREEIIDQLNEMGIE